MKWLLPLCVVTLAFSGCSSISDSIGEAVADKATEKIIEEVEASINVKDAFVDGLDHVFVTFGELSLLQDDTWVPIGNEITRVDVLAYQEAGEFAEIARFHALNVNYTSIRIPILGLDAEKDGLPVPVQLLTPVIEVDVDFSLEEGFAALIDFDLAESFSDDGDFIASIKDVQLSTDDADGDGVNDFEDTDDDNDGLLDHEDEDVDGDGRSDAPAVTKQIQSRSPSSSTSSSSASSSSSSSGHAPHLVRVEGESTTGQREAVATEGASGGYVQYDVAASTRVEGAQPWTFSLQPPHESFEPRAIAFVMDCGHAEFISVQVGFHSNATMPWNTVRYDCMMGGIQQFSLDLPETSSNALYLLYEGEFGSLGLDFFDLFFEN